MKHFLPVFALILLLPLSAEAHPGHGLDGHGAAHFVSSPYHWAVFLGAGAGLFAMAQRAGRFAPLLRAAGVLCLAFGAAWSLKS